MPNSVQAVHHDALHPRASKSCIPSKDSPSTSVNQDCAREPRETTPNTGCQDAIVHSTSVHSLSLDFSLGTNFRLRFVTFLIGNSFVNVKNSFVYVACPSLYNFVFLDMFCKAINACIIIIHVIQGALEMFWPFIVLLPPCGIVCHLNLHIIHLLLN